MRDDLIEDYAFDDTATLMMGTAFDQACDALPAFACSRVSVRELIAVRIINAAKDGKRDPRLLIWSALFGLGDDPFEVPAGALVRDRAGPALIVIARSA